MIFAAAVLAVLGAAAVVYARRAWLQSSALERQLMDTRAQQAEHHKEDLHRADQVRERIEAQIRCLREETSSLARDLAQLGTRIGSLSSGVTDLTSQVTIGFGPGIEAINTRISAVVEMVEILSRKPLAGPIDTGHLETKTEEQVIALAQSLVFLRPLVPYPKWRFDMDWANPDLAFLLRQRLWQYFNDREREAEIIVNWHCGTRIRLRLGNDLSRQIYIAGCIDPNEFVFLDRLLQAGMTFLDAGANEGIYTVFAAKRVGPAGTVWAFEPSQREISRLQQNLELNALNVRVFPLALAERAGDAEMALATYGHEGLNTMGQFVHDIGESRQESIRLARLDDVIRESPLARLDVMKIDVEGAELRLLQGAASALARYRPILLVEAFDATLRQQGASLEELLDYIRTRGYDLYSFDRYSGLPSRAGSGGWSDNMVAVPAEMVLPDAVYQPWPMPGSDKVW